MSRVTVFRHNGSMIAQLVKNDNELQEFAVKVVKERLERGLYPKPDEPHEIGFKHTDVKKIENEGIKKLAKSELDAYTAFHKEFLRQQEKYDQIAAYVNLKEGEACLKLLHQFRRQEGHEFEIYQLVG